MSFKLITILKEWRITLMLLALIMSIFIINPRFETSGVMVTSVTSPASSYLSKGMIITNINGYDVANLTNYNEAVSNIKPGDQVIITYKEQGSFNQYITSTTYPFLAVEENNETKLGISVSSVPFSNLEFGLDLSGGTKVILKPESKVSDEELTNIVGILEQRLNIYVFKEIPINTVADLRGEQYIKIELPSSVSVENIEQLLESEGVFEARVGNTTVYTGEDILGVCLTGVDCVSRVTQSQGGYVFEFSLTVSEKGAEQFANKTGGLSSVNSMSDCYLNESIAFFLDGELLDNSELKISCNLKGVPERSPVIRGGAETLDEARDRMKSLKSMLQSQNLPVKLNIESIEVISPKLGQEFLQNILVVFLLSIISVDLMISIRYRSLRIAIPIIFVTLSEILITLGAATIFKWTFDLASIAGLIASVGTGVDDQIVITDEVLSRQKTEEFSFKDKIKRAFFIVFATFTISIAVMLPLIWAGAGILRGFAITTIIAISVGVFITRPAYARILELIVKRD